MASSSSLNDALATIARRVTLGLRSVDMACMWDVFAVPLTNKVIRMNGSVFAIELLKGRKSSEATDADINLF